MRDKVTADIPVCLSDTSADKSRRLRTVGGSGPAAPDDVERARDICNSDGLLEILSESGGGVGNGRIVLLSEFNAGG